MGTTAAWYSEGGPSMVALIIVGVTGLAILLERGFIVVLRSGANGRPFIERVIQLVRGGKIDEAIKACANSTASLPDMGLLILRSRSRDESDLQNVASAAELAVIPKLTRRLHYLPTLAVAAVLLGVLGTVLGFRDTLLSVGIGADRTERLSRGFGGALTPTAFGLGMAVVLVLGRAYLVSQAENITEQIHEFSARLINALIDRPDVRLGHR